MSENKSIYFASDFHLGVPDEQSSRDRENAVVRWLDFVRCERNLFSWRYF